MKFDRKEISKFLTMCKKLTTKSSLPVLSHVVVSSDGGDLKIQATDLRIWLEAVFLPIGGNDYSDASLAFDETLFPVTSLIDALKESKAKHVDVFFIDNELIFGDAPVYRATDVLSEPTMSMDKYPERVFNSMESVLEGTIINPDVFTEISKHVSDDVSRYYMNGTHLKFNENNSVTAEATNGRKVVFCKDDFGTYEVQDKKQFDTILVDSGVIVWDISRFLKLNPDVFKISTNGNRIMVHFYNEKYSIYVDCIDGQFPNTERVIPEISEATHFNWEYDVETFWKNIARIKSQAKVEGFKYKDAKVTFANGFMSVGINDDSVIHSLESNMPEGYTAAFMGKLIDDCMPKTNDGKITLSVVSTNAAISYHPTLPITTIFMPMSS